MKYLNNVAKWTKNRSIAIDLNRNKKKRGFTLIELIAVIAIIGILATVILPKVSGYIKEAKKLKVVDQCRKVVMAVESYKIKNNKPLGGSESVSDIMDDVGIKKYIEGVSFDNLETGSTSIKNCYDIINGAEFDLVKDTEKLDASSITNVSSSINNTNNTNNVRGSNSAGSS